MRGFKNMTQSASMKMRTQNTTIRPKSRFHISTETPLLIGLKKCWSIYHLAQNYAPQANKPVKTLRVDSQLRSALPKDPFTKKAVNPFHNFHHASITKP